MTRRNALAIAIGCLCYAAALVAMLPAAWMAKIVEQRSGQALLLRLPAGTAWSGSGHLYLRQRSGDLLDIGGLRWSASPWKILTGKLAVDFSFGDAASAMQVELSPSSAAVYGLNLVLPGQVISSVAPRLEALGPQGTLLIRSDSLRVEGDSVLGLASIEWRKVRLARAPDLDFGSQIARLRGGGNKLDIELGTTEGPLRLSGAGAWTRASGLAVAGALEHGEDRSAGMAPFFQGVCSEYRNMRCEFRFAQ